MAGINDILTRAKRGYNLGSPVRDDAGPADHSIGSAAIAAEQQPPSLAVDLEAEARRSEEAEAASGNGSPERASGAIPAAKDTPMGSAPSIDQPAAMSDLVLPRDDDATLVGIAMLKRFIVLDQAKKRVDEIGDEASARINAMRMRIAEWFAEQGMETVRVDGYTVYIRRQLWAGYQTPDGDLSAEERRGWKQRFIDMLKTAKWTIPDPDQPGATRTMSTGHLIHDDYNAQTLSALIRELPVDEQGEPMLPPELKSSIKITYNIMPCKRKTR